MFFCEFLIARAHWGPSGPSGAHDRAPLKESSHEQHIQTHLFYYDNAYHFRGAVRTGETTVADKKGD